MTLMYGQNILPVTFRRLVVKTYLFLDFRSFCDLALLWQIVQIGRSSTSCKELCRKLNPDSSWQIAWISYGKDLNFAGRSGLLIAKDYFSGLKPVFLISALSLLGLGGIDRHCSRIAIKKIHNLVRCHFTQMVWIRHRFFTEAELVVVKILLIG